MLRFRKRTLEFALIATAAGSVLGLAVPFWVTLTLIGAVLIIGWRMPLALVIALGLGVGAFRGWWMLPPTDRPINTWFSGMVTDVSSYTQKNSISVRLQHERITVYLWYGPLLAAGDELAFQCSRWKQQSAFAIPSCTANNAIVTGHNAGTTIDRAIRSLRNRIEESIRRSLASPEAPFLAGLLLGDQSEIPAAVQQEFRATGTTHILAVSGFNVTIVVTMIAAFVQLLPLSTAFRSALTLTAIVGFVLLTGASASVVRAGIMGSMVIVARMTGRLSDAGYSLLLCACAMVFIDPRTAVNIGFQLSVGATAGLILFSDLWTRWLRWVPDFLGIRSSLAATLAATMSTQPIILLAFGQASLVSPIVNLVVLPLVPLAMLLGSVIALVHAVLPAVGPVISWIAWVPLTAILAGVRLGSRLPGAGLHPSMAWTVCIAIVMTTLAGFLAFNSRRTHEQ